MLHEPQRAVATPHPARVDPRDGLALPAQGPTLQLEVGVRQRRRWGAVLDVLRRHLGACGAAGMVTARPAIWTASMTLGREESRLL